MPDAEETQLIREATDIFLRLRDEPDDPSLQQERDRFLARGAAERAAYTKLLQAWKVTDPGKKSGPSSLPAIIVAGALIAGGYLAFEPVRIALIADHATRFETAAAELTSGDQVVLDATSALVDHTEGAAREVTLLRGAAFFDVQPDDRPFVVTSGEIRVAVTGTSFEVGQFDDGGIVSVVEGSVDVFVDSQSWQVSAGEEFTWSDVSGAHLTQVEATTTASWRQQVLVADSMTFAQIAAVLDRRLPGSILITDAALAQTPIVGTFDLAEPSGALDLLVELTGARVTTVPYTLTVLRP